MRTFLSILAAFFSLTAVGQIEKNVKIINGITLKPVGDVYCNLLKNNDEWLDLRPANKKGILRISIQKVDSNSSYQVAISENGFEPQIQNIDLLGDSLLVIKLYPDRTAVRKKRGLTYLECSSTFFGNYRPKEPRSIYDLPDSIRIKLESHLIDRLGQEFYAKLKISGGQIVDLERLDIIEHLKEYRWTPYSYNLCFSFRDVSKGIGLYTAKIVLDKYANVVEEITLPDIKHYPAKGTLISFREAKAVARKHKCYDRNTQIALDYDKKNGSIIWRFKKTIYSHGDRSGEWILKIDAHDGKVIEKYKKGNDMILK